MLKQLFLGKRGPEASLNALVDEANLPPFPGSVMRMLKVLRDPDSSLEEVVEAAQCDPGLILRMLSMVNTAAYGIRQEIRSVSQAVAFMGRAKLESLVVTLAVQDLLPKKPSDAFDSQRFWRAAAFRASLAKLLAERLHPGETEEYFLYAFLQDMGLPVLASAQPEQYDTILRKWLSPAAPPLHELEQETFGWNHSNLGARLAEHWNLPAALRQAIAVHHHHDSGAEGRSAVDLVAHVREYEEDDGVDHLIRQGMDRYQLPQPWLEDRVAEARDRSQELVRVMES
jgi:HD-like signal output (HDOD) protein